MTCELAPLVIAAGVIFCHTRLLLCYVAFVTFNVQLVRRPSSNMNLLAVLLCAGTCAGEVRLLDFRQLQYHVV